MTETETRNHHAGKQQNGGAMAAETSTVEDVFDDTYAEKEGPKPPRTLVWRNIILMTLLHVASLYGLVLLPSASAPTLAWSEYSVVHCRRLSATALFFFFCLSSSQATVREERMW